MTVRYQSREWTEDEAKDLLRQGYAPERIAERTGYSLKWVRAQAVPRMALKKRLTQRKGYTG